MVLSESGDSEEYLRRGNQVEFPYMETHYKPSHVSRNPLSKNYTCEESQCHLSTIYTLLSEKAGLKLNIQKTKIMASGPITSWQIDVETVSDFILGVSKITVDGDCSHEIKRCLLLGRKVMTNLDGILKSREITLPTKVYLVKATVFPVVLYGCDCWTVKKAEHEELMLLNCGVGEDS